jgi:glycerol-3-phosphate acyltransferase PlsX
MVFAWLLFVAWYNAAILQEPVNQAVPARLQFRNEVMMRIVVDAMGSDNRPKPDVEGAVAAAREYSDTIILVGDPQSITAELALHNTNGLSIEVVSAREEIMMTDKPSIVARSKPESSMHVGLNLVKEGKGDAFVTCGNTGAALAIATLKTLRRIPGVMRPALTTLLTIGEYRWILVDIGANADCKPEWLQQFAIMGSIYAERAMGHQAPRVALLSNGEEEGKGNLLIKDTAELLSKSSLNFIGNIEPKELFRGYADVIVMDGFVGNITIKTLEALGDTLFKLIKTELMHDLRSKVGGALARPAFKRVYRQVDPFEVGGAPLLGVDGVVIIGHGRTNALGVKNAIRQARQAVAGQIIEAIREGIVGYQAVEKSLSTEETI